MKQVKQQRNTSTGEKHQKILKIVNVHGRNVGKNILFVKEKAVLEILYVIFHPQNYNYQVFAGNVSVYLKHSKV